MSEQQRLTREREAEIRAQAEAFAGAEASLPEEQRGQPIGLVFQTCGTSLNDLLAELDAVRRERDEARAERDALLPHFDPVPVTTLDVRDVFVVRPHPVHRIERDLPFRILTDLAHRTSPLDAIRQLEPPTVELPIDPTYDQRREREKAERRRLEGKR